MSRIIRNIDNINGGNFTSGVSFDSQYSTNFLTSKSQNDFNIPDLSSYNVICFKGNTDIDLKGLESSNLTNWNGLLILNALNNDKRLKIKKNKASSQAENRFEIADDITLENGEFWWIVYNQDRQRWNVQAKL
jgi:hypothetical protein